MHELLLGLFAAAPLLVPLPATDEPELALLDHQSLTSALAELGSAHPEVATVLNVGTSREGRAIDAIQLSSGDEPGKPAILLVANLDGPDVFDSVVALEHARRLATSYGDDEAITELLRSTTILIIPRANPDAAEARFAATQYERLLGGRGVDNDRDGRSGEDPPSDVDGDGVIVKMRVVDPEGIWIVDPTDERALVKADRKQGEEGKYRVVTEGRDLDGDERIAEDPLLDTRLNKNFPSGWEEHGQDAGLFPSDEPEVRALMEFVMARDDIALVTCYGAPENLVEKPKSVKDDARSVMRIPPAGILQSDADMLAVIAKDYQMLTSNTAKRKARDAGTFQRWAYDHRGLLTLSAVLWEMPEKWAPKKAKGEESSDDESDAESDEETEDATEEMAAEESDEDSPVGDLDKLGYAEGAEGEEDDDAKPKRKAAKGAKAGKKNAKKKKDEPKPSMEAKRLRWIDGSKESWRFVDWKSFEHPELGTVEIGGFAPYALHEPPKSEWSEIAEREFKFLTSLGSYLPRLELTECVANDLGGGLWRIEATVENHSLLPLQSRSARRTRTIRPAKLMLTLPAGAELLGGQARELISDLAGSGGREELVWLVRASSADQIEVSIESVNAGGATVRPEVQ